MCRGWAAVGCGWAHACHDMDVAFEAGTTEHQVPVFIRTLWCRQTVRSYQMTIKTSGELGSSEIQFTQNLQRSPKANVHDTREDFGIEAEVVHKEHFVILWARMNVNVINTRLKIHSPGHDF